MVEPLVPHTGTLSAPERPTTYTWATDIINSDLYQRSLTARRLSSRGQAARRAERRNRPASEPLVLAEGVRRLPVTPPLRRRVRALLHGNRLCTERQHQLRGHGEREFRLRRHALRLLSRGPRFHRAGQSDAGSRGTVGCPWSTTMRGLVPSRPQRTATLRPVRLNYDPDVGSPPAALVPSYGAITVTGSPSRWPLGGREWGLVRCGGRCCQCRDRKMSVGVRAWPSSQNDVLPCAWAQAVRGAILSGTLTTTQVMGTTQLPRASAPCAADWHVDARRVGVSTGLGRDDGTLEVTAEADPRDDGADREPGEAPRGERHDNMLDRGEHRDAERVGILHGGAYSYYSWLVLRPRREHGHRCLEPLRRLERGQREDLYCAACSSYVDANLKVPAPYSPRSPASRSSATFDLSGPTTILHDVPGHAPNSSGVALSPLLFGGVSTTKSPSSGTTLTDATATVNPLVQGKLRSRAHLRDEPERDLHGGRRGQDDDRGCDHDDQHREPHVQVPVHGGADRGRVTAMDARSRPAANLNAEDGFTLAEMVIATAILSIRPARVHDDVLDDPALRHRAAGPVDQQRQRATRPRESRPPRAIGQRPRRPRGRRHRLQGDRLRLPVPPRIQPGERTTLLPCYASSGGSRAPRSRRDGGSPRTRPPRRPPGERSHRASRTCSPVP